MIKKTMKKGYIKTIHLLYFSSLQGIIVSFLNILGTKSKIVVILPTFLYFCRIVFKYFFKK